MPRDNPSTFDTAELVPHFFDQYYVLDNLWLTAKGRDRLGVDFETTGRTLVYRTTALTTGGRVELTRTGSRWTMTMFAGASGTVNYSAKQRVARSALVAGLTIRR